MLDFLERSSVGLVDPALAFWPSLCFPSIVRGFPIAILLRSIIELPLLETNVLRCPMAHLAGDAGICVKLRTKRGSQLDAEWRTRLTFVFAPKHGTNRCCTKILHSCTALPHTHFRISQRTGSNSFLGYCACGQVGNLGPPNTPRQGVTNLGEAAALLPSRHSFALWCAPLRYRGRSYVTLLPQLRMFVFPC